MRSYRYLKIVFPFFFLIGCSSSSDHTPDLPENIAGLENLVVHDNNLENTENITLTKEVMFEETEEVLWGRIIKELTVDKRGRVFIADMVSNKIHVYERDGTFKVSLGRGGQGPGEFNTIWSLKTDDKYLHVFDQHYSKISLYDLKNLNHIKDFNIALDQKKTNQPVWVERMKAKGFFYKTTNFEIYSEDKYLVFFSPIQPAKTNAGQTKEISLFSRTDEKFTKNDLHSFNSAGTALYLDENDGGGVWSDVVFKPRARIVYSSGKIIYGWNEEMLFKIYDACGVYQSAFYYPFQNAMINDEDLFALYMNPDEQIKKVLQKYAPKTWPAYDDMVVDDQNRLWISTIVNNFEIREWWVLDLNDAGKILGKLRMSRDKDIKEIKGGFIYTTEHNFESGLRRAVKYSFSFNEEK